MTDWRIYYANGSTFDSNDGAWNDAPLDRVIAVNGIGDSPTLNEFNHYLMPPGHDRPITADDLGPQIREHCRWIKNGLWVPRQLYHEIMGKVLGDTEFVRRRK